jgi:hypothetical protein
MNAMKSHGKRLSTAARAIEQAARASFDDRFTQQEKGLPGYIEQRDFFFSMVSAAIRCSDMARNDLESWRQSIAERKAAFNDEDETDYMDVVAALISLTDFLIERSNPEKGGFAPRRSHYGMLSSSNEWAKRTRANWAAPSRRVPIVHESVTLSPEGVMVWEDAMNPESPTAKPVGFVPRRIAEHA